jgi:hypothetical protein
VYGEKIRNVTDVRFEVYVEFPDGGWDWTPWTRIANPPETRVDSMHARNDQYRIVLADIEDTAFFSTGLTCIENEPYSIGYRKEGNRLVVDFGMSSDNVKVSNLYDLVEDRGFPKGVWKYSGNKVREVLDSAELMAGEIDSLLEMDEAFYGEEVLYIGADRIDFSYPHIYIYPISELKYRSGKGGDASVRYVGKDSVVIEDGDHQVSLRYRPYHSLSAHSSLYSPAVSATLDSCNAWDVAMEDTWLYDFLYPSSGLEKASAGVRRRFRSLESHGRPIF